MSSGRELFNLKGKRALITGSSQGIGFALAKGLDEAGAEIILNGRNKEKLEKAAKALTPQNNLYQLSFDVTDKNEIDNVVNKFENEIGSIEILVNNAGMGFVGAIEETSLKEVRTVFEANFFGTLKLTQTVLPFMRKENKGHIIQISSHGGIKAFAGFGIYNASKFALEGFSEALAQEVAPLGIKVSIVEPGPFRTKFAGDGLGLAEKIIDDYSETAGSFRTKLKGVDGKQEGDPIKASKAIIDLIKSEKSTLRLPLGKVALMTIELKINSVRADIEANKSIAESVVFNQ